MRGGELDGSWTGSHDHMMKTNTVGGRLRDTVSVDILSLFSHSLTCLLSLLHLPTQLSFENQSRAHRCTVGGACWLPDGRAGTARLLDDHSCQISNWFPGQFEKTIQQNTEKFHTVILGLFKGFGKEIFHKKTNFTSPKLNFIPTVPKKKYFPGPFLPLLTKIGGWTANQNTSAKRYF